MMVGLNLIKDIALTYNVNSASIVMVEVFIYNLFKSDVIEWHFPQTYKIMNIRSRNALHKTVVGLPDEIFKT